MSSMPLTTKTPEPSSFARLLIEKALQIPDWPVFEQGYLQSREAVARGGIFEFEGLRLTAPAGVYPPRAGSSTSFVAAHWDAAGLATPTGSLLELGTGAGGLALLARRAGWRVFACDLDPVAVTAAKANARANRLDVEISESDLFSAYAGKQFDTILFNLPFYHKCGAVAWNEHTLADVGGGLANKFLDEAKGHLAREGRIVFTYSNCSHPDLLARDDWDFDIVGCDYDSGGRYWRGLLVGRVRA